MTTTTSTSSLRGRWAGLLLAALAAVLAFVLPVGTASASGLPAAQTRVGVSHPAVVHIVGVAEHIAAGQHLGRAPSQLRLVSGHCVAAEAGGGVASTTARLQGHVGQAVADFESGAISMSARQARAVGRNPGLEQTYRGQVIDSAVKNAVRNDSELSHLWVSRSGEFGPDFHDIGTGTWWDVTTPGQWLNHVDSYTDPFGAGIGLFTR